MSQVAAVRVGPGESRKSIHAAWVIVLSVAVFVLGFVVYAEYDRAEGWYKTSEMWREQHGQCAEQFMACAKKLEVDEAVLKDWAADRVEAERRNKVPGWKLASRWDEIGQGMSEEGVTGILGSPPQITEGKWFYPGGGDNWTGYVEFGAGHVVGWKAYQIAR